MDVDVSSLVFLSLLSVVVLFRFYFYFFFVDTKDYTAQRFLVVIVS